jgi:isopentenyl diphosphate isomerase/L-lactate dehydrogenase-like FMN-dependent dehydrogenase
VDSHVNVFDWEQAAIAVLAPDLAGYLVGGSGDERALAGNRAAFERLRLMPRVLTGVADPSLETTVLGTTISMPVIVAPVGHQGHLREAGDCATARAAAAAGTVLVVSTMANSSVEEIAAAAPGAPRWFQLYARRDQGHQREIVQRAEAAGYRAIGLTVDLVSLGRREREVRGGFRLAESIELPSLHRPDETSGTLQETSSLLERGLSWTDVERLGSLTSLPVVVKGILHPRDAKLAVEHGCAGVVVSNHGGRQLDGAIAPIDALPRIADAVAGRLELYLDSGVRRGVDVVAALALGARAVLVGRAPIYGLVVGGEQGVRAVLEVFRAELENALHLCGVASATAVPRDLVVTAT